MTIRSAVLSSVVCLLLGLSAAGCGSGGNNGATGSGGTGGGGSTGSTPLTAAQFGAKYKFSATDLAGWAPADPATDPTAYDVYNGGDELVARLDGGDMYTPNGCRVSMYEDMTGSGQEICTAIAMDFGTAANAAQMFAVQQGNGASISIPGYDPSVALASSFALGGQNTYAHINASYFELQFSGFADATSAGAAAKLFLDVFKAKTN